MFRLLVFLAVISYSECWDQIAKRTFQAIYPDFKDLDVWKLTYRVNRQNSTKNAKKVLNNWIYESWVELGLEEGTMTPFRNNWNLYAFLWPKQDSPAKMDAKERGIEFLEHRDAMKKYIQYMFKTVQRKPFSKKSRVFYRDEAVLMRQLFWEADKECLNNFTCTSSLFLKKCAVELEGSLYSLEGEFIAEKLREFSLKFHLSSYAATKLNWKLENETTGPPVFVPWSTDLFEI